ncbi:MAG: ThiF family adenylyltransferase, partial [Planctomycetes bacterium]|nr:ThiF family adenylyltransferase [Planctomycetota bacterium]
MIEERYRKQVLFDPIGREGRRGISTASAVVVGCGAVGGTVAASLTRAGIGELRIIDRDFVQWQNLHRQPLFNEDHAQKQLPKAVAAAKTLGSINSEVKLDPRVEDRRS